MEDRSLHNVIKYISKLPGVNTIINYELSRSAVREIASAFPNCKVEAEFTVVQLLDIMNTENVDRLTVSQEEMEDIARNIAECVSREEFGTYTNPGIMDWVFGSIKGDSLHGSYAIEPDILKNIGQFMGTEADRAKNLSPNQFLARSGDFNEFVKKVNKNGLAIDEDSLKAAMASQNLEAYRSVKEILMRRGIRGISIPPTIAEDRGDDSEYALFFAAFYGAEDIMREEIQEFINSNKPNWEASIPLWLMGATYGSHANIIRYLLDIAPPVVMNELIQGDIFRQLWELRLPLSRNTFPVRGGNIAEAIEAWFQKVDNDPRGYNNPHFVNSLFYFAPEFKTKLNGRRLANFIRQIGVDTDVSRRIYDSLLEESVLSGKIPIQLYPLNETRLIMDLFPPEPGNNFDIFIDHDITGMTDEEKINITFKYPEGYYEYLTANRGFNLSFNE
jgi:hypothetical protein